jgi:5-methylcytosine-specific restriction enzyme A
MRKEFSRSVRVAAWKRADGCCQECTRRLYPGDARFDHIIPAGLGGDATLDQCRVLCRWCHDVKTFGSDVPAIARAKRREASHVLGAERSRNPIRGWRKFDGTAVKNPRA